MRLGYNTNGLPHHRLKDAIPLLAEEGYESVGLTLEAGALDPYEEPDVLKRQMQSVRSLLERHQMASVIETGARYVLNPRLKHDPTLMDPDPVRRAIRVDFLKRSIDIAVELRADCVSFWSGILRDQASESEGLERLRGALIPVIEHAERLSMPLAFEPEPGMFIDTFARFSKLDEQINHPLFDLTVDIGHVHCLEDGTISSHLQKWAPRVRNLHIEDMVRGVHEHLMFGQGTIEFEPVIQVLEDLKYQGGLHVELSRHGHMGAEAVNRSMAFLKPMLSHKKPS